MKHVLVIRFSALGDVAILVPIVRQVALSYPNVHISVLSRKQTAALFVGLPDNVSFVGADLKGKHAGIRGLNRLLHELPNDVDAVVDAHAVLRSWYLRSRFWWRGKRVRSLRKGRVAKWLYVHHRLNHLPMTIARYADVFRRIGLPIDLPTLGKQAVKTFSERAGIGIAPFAAHTGKIYSPDRMYAVVQQLSAYMHEHLPTEKIYLFGGGEMEQAVLRSWAQEMPNVQSLAGMYSMDKELTIMAGLRLIVTMDSANMHMASLVGTRVLSLWGATHPEAGFLGYGQSLEDCLQRDLACRPCSMYGNKPCRYGDYRCLNMAPEMVIEEIKKRL